jgi:hypothetical protein
MVRSATIATSIGLVGALPNLGLAESMDVSECAFSQSYGGTVSYEGHRDIGNGFVIYLERNVGLDGNYEGGRFIMAGCKSGLTLAIDYAEEQLPGMQDYVLVGAASKEKVTLSTFNEHFSSLGLSTIMNEQSLEHCACAAFYPESKGMKGAWMKRYEHP